jgi:cytidylate kinase
MKQYVITIGREFGSQGKEIGEKLAERLGIKCYDEEIMDMAAEVVKKKPSLLEGYDESMDTVINKNILNSLKANSIQDNLFHAESDVIKGLVEKESCVIIGRCADHILREMKHAIHVFIYSPYGVKYNRVLNEYGLTHAGTEKMLVKIDRARHDYYKRYTKKQRRARDGKHLLVDSSLLGIDGTVEMLYCIVNMKFNHGKCMVVADE